jgi:hypothetical protein
MAYTRLIHPLRVRSPIQVCDQPTIDLDEVREHCWIAQSRAIRDPNCT